MKTIIFILLIAYYICNPTLRTTDNLSCGQYEELKKDCGYFGINQKTCEEKGCCWKESQDPKVPWCFEGIDDVPTFKTNSDKSCFVAKELREECGYKGIDKEECESRDCCWEIDDYESLVPWCFHGYKDSSEATKGGQVAFQFGEDE